MSIFNPGEAQLLFSTNLPAAFLEAACILNEQERAFSTIENPLNNITITADFEARSVAIAASLPIQAVANAVGGISVNARNYLVNPITFGNNSDLKSDSFPGGFLELAQLLNAAEKTITNTPTNNITIAFDLEAETATVTATLPIFPNRTASGNFELIAADYVPHFG